LGLSGSLPEPLKTQENLKKFVKIVVDDARIRGQLVKLVSPDCECKKAEEAVVSSFTAVYVSCRCRDCIHTVSLRVANVEIRSKCLSNLKFGFVSDVTAGP